MESITIDKHDQATAFYGWYKEFDTPFTFEQIGGDPRNNKTNSINSIPEDREEEILDILIGEAELDPIIQVKESELEYKLTGKRPPRKSRTRSVSAVDIDKEAVDHVVRSISELHKSLMIIAPGNKWEFGNQLKDDYRDYLAKNKTS